MSYVVITNNEVLQSELGVLGSVQVRIAFIFRLDTQLMHIIALQIWVNKHEARQKKMLMIECKLFVFI